jgi:hypothetical protein
VQWELSADAGTTWQTATPGGGSVALAPGNDLLWRATLSVVPPFPTASNPGVSQVDVEWFLDRPIIDAISDVANDQGRQVRLEWTRSGHDFVGDASQIYEYTIHRKIDANLSSVLEVAGQKDGQIESIAQQNDLLARVSPPGWDFVMTVPADAEQSYAVVVPTLADSTIAGGVYHSTFLVRARTATPGVFFDSHADSGYSVDNLEPSVPASFAVAYNTGSGNQLSWDPAPEADFQHFRIYRDTDPNFNPSAGNLVDATTATGWTDPSFDEGTVYYKVTAVDFSGNESDAASPGTTTGTQEPRIPKTFALDQNTPNPFNPTTVISYDVPEGGGHVTLRIYDVSGRLVRTLVDESQTPGEKRVTWDARNNRGETVATGVYFYRMKAPGFVKTRKMVLLR